MRQQMDSVYEALREGADFATLTGFRNALTKTFNDYGRKNKLLKDSEPALTGEDIREGLTAIISVKIESPVLEF